VKTKEDDNRREKIKKSVKRQPIMKMTQAQINAILGEPLTSESSKTPDLKKSGEKKKASDKKSGEKKKASDKKSGENKKASDKKSGEKKKSGEDTEGITKTKRKPKDNSFDSLLASIN